MWELSSRRDIINKLTALDDRNPVLPVAPVAEGLKGTILTAVQQLIQSQEPELVAAIRTEAQARANQLKTQLASQIANTVTSKLNRSFSFYDSWFDPIDRFTGTI